MRIEPDPEQAPVLDHERGNLLVTGPPGSGKTALLRERFARLVEGGAEPEGVAMFALSRRAARDARDHLVRRLGHSMADLPVWTAHGFAFRLLGSHFEDLGYAEPPQVLSAPEQYAFVREMLREEKAADWPRFGALLGLPGFVRQVSDYCLRAQERLLTPEEIEELARRAGREEQAELAAFYKRYVEALASAGQVDFAGLLLQAVTLLEKGSGERYRHVLVDDYQDTTLAAEGMLRVLAGAAESVVVAADPAGHVFSYRGGSLEPLGRIRQTLPGCAEVTLTASRRLGASVASVTTLDDPVAVSSSPAEGIRALRFAHPGEEVEAVARELLRARVEEDVPWEEMAVIVRRYGAYLTALRHALARHGVPFVVVAEAAAVATEPANRPVIDLLRYVFQPERRAEVVEAVLSSPLGGLDPHAVRELRREARRRGLTLLALIEGDEDLDAPLGEPVASFRRTVRSLEERGKEHGPDRLFFDLWSEHPWFAGLVADEGRGRDLDALAALGDVLSRFVERRPTATVHDYLETLEVAEFGPDPWMPPEERHPHAVRIVSAHRAQGIEFEVAMLVGCLEGEFPSLAHGFPLVDLDRLVAPATPSERLRARLAEERALFRLAVSRARRRTILFASESTSARNPRTPSRFAARLGLEWQPDEASDAPATSLRMLESSLRRTLSDATAEAPARLAALAALPVVGARPGSWWGGRDWSDPGAPMHEGEIHTSYSRLSTLENCSLQYLYSSEMGLDTKRTHSMWLGTLVHDIIERVNRGQLERTQEAMFGALEVAWRPDVFPNRALEHRRYLDAQKMIRQWLADTGSGDFVAAEKQFRFPIDGAMMRGRIDAIFRMENGRLRVVDYKTSKTAPTQPQVQENLQLAAYYLALLREPELKALGEPGLLELAFVFLEGSDGYARRQVNPESRPGYEEWAEQTIKGHLATVRAERFAPNPEADCMFCDFKVICPLYPEGEDVRA